MLQRKNIDLFWFKLCNTVRIMIYFSKKTYISNFFFKYDSNNIVISFSLSYIIILIIWLFCIESIIIGFDIGFKFNCTNTL